MSRAEQVTDPEAHHGEGPVWWPAWGFSVTACTFGGPALDALYITTSRLGGGPEPAAGAVFRADVGVPGLPALTYAG